MIKFILISIPTSLLGNFIAKIMLHFFTTFFAGLVGGLVSVGSYLILTKLFNLFDIKNVLTFIKSNKKKA